MTDSGTAEPVLPDAVLSSGNGAPVSDGRPPGSPEPGSQQDWTDQVTALIVDSVDKVRSRTTGPILEVTRGSVHALVAIMLLLPVAVLFLVLAVRVLTYYVFGEVWITYTVLGTLFTLAGVVLWSRRHARSPRR